MQKFTTKKDGNSSRKEFRFTRKNWQQLKRAINFAQPYRWFIVAVLILTLFIAGMNVTEPLIMKYIFDGLTEEGALNNIMWGIALFVGLAIFREGFMALSNWLSWRIRLAIHYSLLDQTVERIHRLPAEIHQKDGVGAMMTKLDRGIQGFIGAISEVLFNIIPAIAYLIMAAIVMFQLDWRLTIAVLVFTPIPAIIAVIAAPAQTSREKFLLNKWGKIYSRFNEVLSGIVTVRSFVMEDYEKKRFMGDVGEANERVVNGIRYDQTVGAFQNLAGTIARISAIAVGGFLIIKGEATLGTLIAFLGYVGGLFGPIQNLTEIYRVIRTATVSLKHVFAILDTQSYLGDEPDAVEMNNISGSVQFENVYFSYKKRGQEVLKGFDLHVKAGETLAIVGPSGSGKSTLMSLIQRFYDPTKGSIKIDDTDIRTIKQKSLRKQIGVVQQEPLLFNETIRDNISYGRLGASESDITEVAKHAHAHNFIMQLEKGYDTIAGERGGRLSVGERQRVAIARTLLKNPPVLIMDEATSALDAESEAIIQEALNVLIKDRTTFIIAHRLSTVVSADKIIVLNNGRIIETGNNRELLDMNGYYAFLVRHQTAGMTG